MSWSAVLDHMVAIIEAGTDLGRAPVAFSAEDVPATLAGRVFCFGLEFAGDLGTPGSGRVLDRHSFEVRILYRLGGNWLTDVKTMQDDSKAVRDALVVRGNYSHDIEVANYQTERLDGTEYVIRSIQLVLTQSN